MAKYITGFSEAHHGGRVRKTTSGRFTAERATDGKIRRATFDLKSEAIGWLKDLGVRRDRQGHVAMALTARQSADALDAYQRLEAAGLDISLAGLVQLHVDGEMKKAVGENIAVMIDKFLADGERKGQRERTMRDKRSRLSSFVNLFGERNLGEITKDDVEGWLYSTGAHGRNLRNYQTTVQSFFNWCGKTVDGYTNTIATFPQDTVKDIEPAATVTPAQARDVLHHMEQNSPEAALALALGCFAGLRTDEITGKDGLQWGDVDFEHGEIIVRAGQAKTRRQRRVEITPNLRAWLVKYRKEDGRITPRYNAFKRHRQAACEAVGITWPSNAARHSFGTYYARIHGAHAAAQFMGHVGGIAVFSESYEGRPVPLAEAERFFKIEPAPSVGAKIIRMEATA